MGWKVTASIIVVGLLVAGGIGWGSNLFRGSEAVAEQLFDVVTTDIEQAILASGTLEPARMVNVGAQVSGQIKKLHVTLGQKVNEGDLIAEIDLLPQQNALRLAETGLANVKAQRVARVANRKQAEATFERQRAMLAGNATSQTDFEAAEATLDAINADIDALDAQVDRAELEVEIAQINLGYTRIVAPMDGVVIAIVTKEGQTLNSAQTVPTIVVVAQMDTMSVKVQISEADIDQVRAGQDVWFTLLGNSNKRYDARLDVVEPAPASLLNQSGDQAQQSSAAAVYFNGTFTVSNADGALRPLMTAQVHIVVASARQTTAVPSSAIAADGKQVQSLIVVDASGKRETRNVTIGIDDKVHVQILEGLAPGDRVALPAVESVEKPVDLIGMA